MKKGQYVVAWSGYLRRPAVSKRPMEITAVGKRVKCTDPNGLYRLLSSEDILAVFDDKDQASALAEELSSVGETYMNEQYRADKAIVQRIIEMAKLRGYAVIYVLDDDREPITIAEFNDSIPEGRANAHMMTAAPEMLAALKAVVSALDGRVHSNPALSALSRAQGAIDMAEGR